MKNNLFLLLLILFINESFCQQHDGESLTMPIRLNAEIDVINKLTLKTSKPLYSNFYSELPTDLTFEIKIISEKSINIKLDIAERIKKDGKLDTTKIKEYVLKDSINEIHLKNEAAVKYLIFSNLDKLAKNDVSIKITLIKTKIEIDNEMNLNFKSIQFASTTNNKYYYTKLNIDEATIAKIDDVEDLIIFDENFNEIALQKIIDEQSKKRQYQILFEKGIYYVKSSNNKKIDIDDLQKLNELSNPTNTIQLLKQWLKETGIEKYFRVEMYSDQLSSNNDFITKEYLSIFNAKKVEIAVSNSIDNIKDLNKKNKTQEEIRNSFVAEVDLLKYTTKDWYDKTKEPTYFIYLHPYLDKTEMGIIESRYIKEFNTTLWNKVFDKIRLFSGTPFDKILIYIPIWCSGDWVYGKQGNIGRCCNECVSGGASSIITNFSSINTNSKLKIENKINIGEKAEVFLKNVVFKNSNPNFEFLERDKFSFSVIVRNIKGYILKEDEKWEKIEIKCFIREGENGKYLQIETDGLYTSGMGNYPKDSQFDKSFEPLHKQNLITFSQYLVTEFKKYLFN